MAPVIVSPDDYFRLVDKFGDDFPAHTAVLTSDPDVLNHFGKIIEDADRQSEEEAREQKLKEMKARRDAKLRKSENKYKKPEDSKKKPIPQKKSYDEIEKDFEKYIQAKKRADKRNLICDSLMKVVEGLSQVEDPMINKEKEQKKVQEDIHSNLSNAIKGIEWWTETRAGNKKKTPTTTPSPTPSSSPPSSDEEEKKKKPKEKTNRGLCHALICLEPGRARCIQCKKVRYCSNQCLRDDWDEHKYECEPRKTYTPLNEVD